jgi:hypothetical protein
MVYFNATLILTHSVSSIDWKHYEHPLPELVHDVYMKNGEARLSYAKEKKINYQLFEGASP